MTIDVITIILTITIGAISVAITFYIKDILKKRSQYKYLKKHLEEIAGKNAEIIYSGEIYKIKEVTKAGLTIHNDFSDIFIPIESAISTNIILPCKDYESLLKEKKIRESLQLMQGIMPTMMNDMIDQMVPKLKEVFLNELGDDEGDFSAVFAVKFRKFIKNEMSEDDIKKLIQSKK